MIEVPRDKMSRPPKETSSGSGAPSSSSRATTALALSSMDEWSKVSLSVGIDTYMQLGGSM